ncbi:MAG: hypothetical protein PW786_03900 [Arachidicoccus sp.]|nr:hypothetical protein [Arachidicoccus sp.]
MKNSLLFSIRFILSATAFSQQNYAFDLSANRNAAIAISNSTDVAGQWTAKFWIYKKAAMN